MLEDKLIIYQFNRGNREVLRQVYEKYKKDLLTLAAVLLYDRNAAEDVVQDVFASFIESAEKFRLTGTLKGYLAVCVANNVRNRNKARQRHQSVGLDEVEPAVSDSERPDFSAMFSEDLQRLAWALTQLPYQQREILLLHVHTGMKFGEIAKLSGESINTLKGRYRYGLDKLRFLLNSRVKNETG
ncbi:MAG: RNA polymerase sigma factor [Planctomycetota bacterium]